MKKPQFPTNVSQNNLGEGKTPLLFLPQLSRELRINMWAKCEYQNPTGSFKDRGSLIEVSKAMALKKTGVVCASTGNMAASLAAYATRNGLTCTVIVPKNTPLSKLQQARSCGATIMDVAGTYNVCVDEALDLARTENLFLCGDYLLRREGQKTMGWELSRDNFDCFIVPVGNGNVGVAIGQGLSEARPDSKIPQFIGVQAEKVNPIEKAWRTNQTIKPQSHTKTIATAFNVGNPLDGALTLDWIKKTDGLLTTVTDDEIILAQQELALKEGIYVERTAAATLAGLIKIQNQFKGQKVVLILTGAGLKEGKE